MENLSTPDEVAAEAMEHIDKGPMYISSDYYRGLMEQMLSLPREDALVVIAGSMKK